MDEQASEVEVKESKDATPAVPAPKGNPATNLLIADIIISGASTLLRKNIDKKVEQAKSEENDNAPDVVDGRTLITTLGLYGASKLATRSARGLAMVTGGLVLKTLYDRGKARQKRLAEAPLNENPDDET